MSTITAAEFDIWVEGLESGEYKQAQGKLRGAATDDSGDAGYCCLGLKCEIDGFDLETVIPGVSEWDKDRSFPAELAGGNNSDEYTSAHLPPLAGLSESLRSSLAEANDEGQTFAQIAAMLRANREDILAGHEPWYVQSKANKFDADGYPVDDAEYIYELVKA